MTPEASRLLLAAFDAIGGRSWGPRFEAVVAALARSGCDELIGLLADAGQLGDRAVADSAWAELRAVAPDGLVLLDLVCASG